MDRRTFGLKLMVSCFAFESLGMLRSAEAAEDGVSPQKLKWNRSLKPAHKLAMETDKPLLIVFGASWCHYCHKLERETLSDKRLVAIIERDFVPVMLDFDRDAKVAKILEVERLPCTVVLSPEADLLQKTEGYADYKGYIKILQAALEKQTAIRQVNAS